jgi:hypothetical protein
MLNPNVGKKALIPINTASKTDKMAQQAMESAKSASFSPPVSPGPKTGQGRGRHKSTGPKTIMKGIYFDPEVYQALTSMQQKGQNVSKFVNRIARQALTL